MTAPADSLLARTATDSLLARTARGASWVVAWRMMTRVLGLISTLVLVRLLLPADFGLVALATAFAVSLDICLAIGVEDQIVRARDPQPVLYDTAFTLNLIRGLFLAVLIAVAAAPAAQFFGDMRLERILFALAFSAAVSGATNIGVADFRRRMEFDKEFRLQFYPRVAGIAAVIVAAFVLRSYWALIIGILTNRFALVAMGHVMSPYRPRLSLAAWRDLVGVSTWTWGIGVASVLRDRADSFFVGRILGLPPLGLYAVAHEVASLPTSELVDPICRACMPGFATALRGEDVGGVRSAYLRINALVALLTIPAGVGMSLIAGPLIALAFGQGWVDAVPVAAILAVAFTMTLFGNVSVALLNAKTLLRTILVVTAGAALLRVLLLVLLMPHFGLVGAGISLGLALVAEHVTLVGLALRMVGLGAWSFLACLRRPAIAAAAMALVLWGCGLGWVAPPRDAAIAIWHLLAAIGLGATVFIGSVAAMWRLAGCPAGAETDLLALLTHLAGRLRLPGGGQMAARGG
ncbi:oligosaccharide flippase family protein [Humitalea sp. 24SJ18S-53]|uniref:oligosaccharide flippase family protein n=1 Tax=Humitalea sp. 24SJ18S-53 TaxID=3422307 RepID=UPI003D678BA7